MFAKAGLAFERHIGKSKPVTRKTIAGQLGLEPDVGRLASATEVEPSHPCAEGWAAERDRCAYAAQLQDSAVIREVATPLVVSRVALAEQRPDHLGHVAQS